MNVGKGELYGGITIRRYGENGKSKMDIHSIVF